MPGDNQLEAVGETRIVLEALGERAHLNRIIADERGIHDGILAALVVDLGDELARTPLGFDLDAALGSGGAELLDRSIE